MKKIKDGRQKGVKETIGGQKGHKETIGGSKAKRNNWRIKGENKQWEDQRRE